MEITIEEIQKKFDELPEDIKWAIIEADVENKIIEIGKKENLNVAQMGQLALELNAAMFGFYPLDKFADSAKASLQLSDDKMKAIVDDVNTLILKSIREKMRESRTETSTETKIPINTVKTLVTDQQTQKEVLGSAGIEIITSKEEIKQKTEAPMEKREDMLEKVEKPELIGKEIEIPARTESKEPTPSIISSKLSGSFKMPAVKTEHSLQNITKTAAPANAPRVATAASNKIPTVDPYREIPE